MEDRLPPLRLLRTPTGWLPITMSLAALGLVLQHVARHGLGRQADEGTAAHLWQLLMAGQLPIGMWFVARWLPRAPKAGAVVLALQSLTFAASLAALWWMEHAR